MFINGILRNSDIVPKILLMKYFIDIINKEGSKIKDYKALYDIDVVAVVTGLVVEVVDVEVVDFVVVVVVVVEVVAVVTVVVPLFFPSSINILSIRGTAL